MPGHVINYQSLIGSKFRSDMQKTAHSWHCPGFLFIQARCWGWSPHLPLSYKQKPSSRAACRTKEAEHMKAVKAFNIILFVHAHKAPFCFLWVALWFRGIINFHPSLLCPGGLRRLHRSVCKHPNKYGKIKWGFYHYQPRQCHTELQFPLLGH